MESFGELAASREPRLDKLILAMAAEFAECDAPGALEQLDDLGAEIAEARAGNDPRSELDAVVAVLAHRHGFIGNRADYDDPHNSMLDRVLTRRTGLPILLSIVYVEASRRAGIDLGGVGLPGHYVAGHFGEHPPLLVDPFGGGMRLEIAGSADLVRWGAHRTALRALTNLVGSYQRRHDLTRAIRAAELRLALPLGETLAQELARELKSIRAALN